MQPRYLIVIGACVTQFTVIGSLFSFGLLFKTFEVEFGWSRTVLSSCSAVAFLVMGILEIAAGRLSDNMVPNWSLQSAGCYLAWVMR